MNLYEKALRLGKVSINQKERRKYLQPEQMKKFMNKKQFHTLYPRKSSTTHASSASRPTVTVTFGTGSTKRGNKDSETNSHKNIYL